MPNAPVPTHPRQSNRLARPSLPRRKPLVARRRGALARRRRKSLSRETSEQSSRQGSPTMPCPVVSSWAIDRTNKLVIFDDVFKQVTDMAGAESAGFFGLTALEIDRRRGDLWVANSSAERGASLHKLQLVSGRVLFEVPVPTDLGPTTVVDIAVLGDGEVLVLDEQGAPAARTLARTTGVSDDRGNECDERHQPHLDRRRRRVHRALARSAARRSGRSKRRPTSRTRRSICAGYARTTVSWLGFDRSTAVSG